MTYMTSHPILPSQYCKPIATLLFNWSLYFLFIFLLKPLLFTFLLQALLSLYFPIETSTFLLLKSLFSLYFSIEISTFYLLFYWNLYFLVTFLLESVRSVTFSTLSYSKHFLLKSLLFDHFPIEIPTFLFTFFFEISTFGHFPIEISTFCHFLSAFLLKSLISVTLQCDLHLSNFTTPQHSTANLPPKPTLTPPLQCDLQLGAANPNLYAYARITHCRHPQPSTTWKPPLHCV